MEKTLFLLVLTCTVLLSLVPVHIHADNPQNPSPMDFLKPLIETRKGNTVRGLSQLKKYLTNLGYMDVNNTKPQPENDDFFDDNLEKAVIGYQTFFNLNVTGVLDAATVALLSQPRCGVPDFKITTPVLRHSRLYTFFPGTFIWPPEKRNLTYSFPPGTRPDTNTAISAATALWANVTAFTFRYIPEYDKADIKISFQYKEHGDGSPFDGKGGMLAHAFAPTDGRLHYDGDEKWVNGIVVDSFDLQTVGLHELGHILGLGHSNDSEAIMWPYIPIDARKFLAKDDIDGIKALYPS